MTRSKEESGLSVSYRFKGSDVDIISEFEKPVQKIISFIEI
jgi:hypothetical protein